MKHSPGPWKASFEDKGSENYNIISEGKVIGSINDWDNTPGSANANLVASAPELLEALIRAAELLNEASGRLILVHAILSKELRSEIPRLNHVINKAKGDYVKNTTNG